MLHLHVWQWMVDYLEEWYHLVILVLRLRKPPREDVELPSGLTLSKKTPQERSAEERERVEEAKRKAEEEREVIRLSSKKTKAEKKVVELTEKLETETIGIADMTKRLGELSAAGQETLEEGDGAGPSNPSKAAAANGGRGHVVPRLPSSTPAAAETAPAPGRAITPNSSANGSSKGKRIRPAPPGR